MGSVSPLDWIGLGTDVLDIGGSYAANTYAADKQYQATRETNAQNYKIWQESQDFSREQADTQWEREMEMFNMENSYNNPVNVVGRLREAGLNPALAMQGSLGSAMSSAASGGSPTIGSTPTAPTMQVPAIGQYYSNIASGISDASLKASMMLKNIAEAKKTGSEEKRLTYSLESFLKEQDAKARVSMLNADLVQRYGYELKDKEVKKLSNEIDNLVLTGDVLQQEFRLKSLEGDIKDVDAHIIDEKYKRIKEYIDNELNMQKAEIMKKEAEALAIPKQVQAQLTSALAAWRSAGAAELSAQTQRWIAENPNDAISYLIRGLSLNGLDAKQVVEWLGKKFGFLKGDLPDSNQVDKLFNSDKWWNVSPVLSVGKGIYDLFK